MSCTARRIASTEKASGLRIDQPVAAARERDHVARDGAQPECRAVDESELSLLHGVHFAALPFAQRLREKENRRERRSQIVSDLDEQLEPTRAGEPRTEAVRVIVLDDLVHALDGAEQRGVFLRRPLAAQRR